VLAVAATAVVATVWAVGGARLTALEWWLYDGSLRARPPVERRSPLVIVARDAASEARFGAGQWDRAVLARLIGGIARGGAAVIGIDVPLDRPSTPGRGGASSDALLSQATALAETVVYATTLDVARSAPATDLRPGVHPSWPARSRWPVSLLEAAPVGGALPGWAQQARGVGHTLAPEDPDGVVRAVPLLVGVGDRVVPAFGLALAATFLNASPEAIALEGSHTLVVARGSAAPLRIAVDRRGRALVRYRAPELGRAFHVVPLGDIWAAIEGGHVEILQGLVDDKVVLVLAEPRQEQRPTPLGVMTEVAIHAHLLDTVLASNAPRQIPLAWTVAGTLVIAGLSAWLVLSLRWWLGLIGVLVLVVAYGASLILALGMGLVLPVVVPASAVAVASAAALVWNQLASGRRIDRLEAEISRVQTELRSAGDVLVRQESAVEALEEDLEAARVAVARSTGAERDLVRATDALRVELVQARAQEEQTRRRLQSLESELRGLRAVDAHPSALPDTERERLRAACERMEIVTRDPVVLAAFRDLEKAARVSLPILLTGEPGTGKELFARAAHRLSARAGRPFVAVNMAAISPELFESELFGHVRGSFTGATGDRKGYFEQADGGTIFLDEIGDLRGEHQGKLLRVLQEKTFYRVGATGPTVVDVRVVAATNRDLERGIAEGWFREDLYFRLKGLVLRLPPLRERAADIPLLAARFVATAAAEIGQRPVTLSEEAARALQRHGWGGNIRELQNCLRQAAALAEGPILTEAGLRLAPAAPRGGGEPAPEADGDAAVLTCLRERRFDMQAAADTLGWDRSTVTQRLKGLGFRALVEAQGDRARAALVVAGDASLARMVELKLREYHEHLLRSVGGFDSAEAAVAACRRRFKNLPERHFRSLELLVRQHFDHRSPPTIG
jgi:DNA-binding NtrC family response regulator/CHASE2 domain-containing sensor protein